MNMDLSKFEYTMRHIRGRNVSFYAGNEALSAEQAAELLAAHERTYGPGPVPGYVSPAGWQTLGPQPGSLASRFEFDESENIVRIDGKRVAGEMLDAFFRRATPAGRWLRVVSDDGDTVTVESRSEDEIAAGHAEAEKAPAPPAQKPPKGRA